MTRRKLTPYQKAIQNLKRRIKTAEKAGYKFDNEIKIPRSTKGVQQLRGEELYKKATGYISSLGEYYDTPPSIKQKRAIEREARKYRESFSYEDFEEPTPSMVILQNVENQIASFDASQFVNSYLAYAHIKNKEYLEGLLNYAIESEGREEIARRLNSYGNPERIYDLVDKGMYDSSDKGNVAQNAIMEFGQIIASSILDQQTSERYSNEYGF